CCRRRSSRARSHRPPPPPKPSTSAALTPPIRCYNSTSFIRCAANHHKRKKPSLGTKVSTTSSHAVRAQYQAPKPPGVLKARRDSPLPPAGGLSALRRRLR